MNGITFNFITMTKWDKLVSCLSNCHPDIIILWFTCLSTRKILFSKNPCANLFPSFIYLFGVLRHFRHCTCHITTGSWKGRGNQYIQFFRVLYCKLPTNSKQLPAFPLDALVGDRTPTSEVGGESYTTLPPWPLVPKLELYI